MYLGSESKQFILSHLANLVHHRLELIVWKWMHGLGSVFVSDGFTYVHTNSRLPKIPHSCSGFVILFMTWQFSYLVWVVTATAQTMKCMWNNTLLIPIKKTKPFQFKSQCYHQE